MIVLIYCSFLIGSTERLLNLLKCPNVNIRDENLRTPLHVAVEAGIFTQFFHTSTQILNVFF